MSTGQFVQRRVGARASTAAPPERARPTPPGARTGAPAGLVRRATACACGGACPRCQSAQAIQIIEPHHDSEHQADRIARDVTGNARASARSVAAPVAAPVVARDNSNGNASRDARAFREGIAPVGHPFDPDARDFFESRFNLDLGAVQLHTDTAAAESARGLGARAYTTGRNIVFGRGEYDPANDRGRALIAHELTHVVQQSGGMRNSSPAPTTTVSLAPNDAVPADTDTTPTLIEVVNSENAVLLNPDNRFAPFQTGTTTENTRLRKPDALSDYLLDSAGQPMHIAPDTSVRVSSEKKEKGVRYSFVFWEDQTGWTRSSELAHVVKATVPVGTSVAIVAEQSVGKHAYSLIAWSDQLEWIESKYITPYDLRGTIYGPDGRLAADLVPKTDKADFATNAPDSAVSAKQINALDSILGRITSRKALLRDPNTGVAQTATIPYGTDVVILEQREQTVDGTAVVTTRVMDFDGNEYWTSSKNIKTESAQIKDASGLSVGNRIDDIQNPKVLAAIQQAYGAKVNALLSTKHLTTRQEELIGQARAFVADPSLQADQTPLAIPDSAKVEDGVLLSTDLAERVDRFYRFMTYVQLVPVGPVSMSGVRAFSMAHMLSTRWMLNPKSKILAAFDNQLKFAELLVAIEGWDPNTPDGTRWASDEQVARLRWLIPIVHGEEPGVGVWGPPPEYSWPGADLMSVDDAKKAISAIVAEIQVNYTAPPKGAPANPNVQSAQAVEGYPKGDPRRWPNIQDVGISNHCGGEAMDIFFDYRFNYFDPIVDDVALIFGLKRPVKDGGSEYWHYERIGVPLDGRAVGDGEQ